MDRCEPTKPRRAFIGVEGMEQRCKSSTPVVRENVLGYFWPLFRQRLTSHGFWSVSFDVPALFCTFPLWDFTEKTVLLIKAVPSIPYSYLIFSVQSLVPRKRRTFMGLPPQGKRHKRSYRAGPGCFWTHPGVTADMPRGDWQPQR